MGIVEDRIINSLSTGNKSKSISDFNILEYYMNNYKCEPSRIFSIHNDSEDIYNYDDIYKELSNSLKDFKIIFEECIGICHKEKIRPRKQYIHLKDGYVLMVNTDSKNDFIHSETLNSNSENELIIHNNNLITPSKYNEFYDSDLEELLLKLFRKNSITIKNNISRISMINVSDGELYARDYEIATKMKMLHMNLHYGDGFDDFHKKLYNKIKNPGKGLVLLHGIPGTGKTYFIRYLLKMLGKTNKNILYFPPTMVSTITDPGFLSFIAEWSSESDNNMLLIEDAEPLLESRQSGRNIGITNLLNLSDGILNDIYKIQVVATFNTELSNIDEALLRPERLIARKEFGKLSIENSKKLIDYLKIKNYDVNKEMTLAEIYSMKNNNEVLLHGVTQKKKMGF